VELPNTGANMQRRLQDALQNLQRLINGRYSATKLKRDFHGFLGAHASENVLKIGGILTSKNLSTGTNFSYLKSHDTVLINSFEIRHYSQAFVILNNNPKIGFYIKKVKNGPPTKILSLLFEIQNTVHLEVFNL